MHAELEGREGDTLRGKYRLEKMLGAGGMGEVYRATNLGIGRVVAIKLLRPEFADRPSIVERFLREAQAANMVRHRNVVDILDIDKDESGTPFIVQEYLEGEDFSSMLERFPDGVPPGIALSVLGPIVDAVRAAHEKGVVHRDLKPENVFLAKLDGVTVPKVLDFGISKLPRSDQSVRLTGTHSIMGSPQYMSPEQILTPQAVDARSDIWSLGVILFQCLSGRQPFEGDTAEVLFVKICHDEPLQLSDVAPHLPEEFGLIVSRCLQRDPSERFPDATELSEALRQLRRSPKFADNSVRPMGERGPVKPETIIGRTDTRSRSPQEARKGPKTEPLGPTALAPQEGRAASSRPGASASMRKSTAAAGQTARPAPRTRPEPARAGAEGATEYEFDADHAGAGAHVSIPAPVVSTLAHGSTSSGGMRSARPDNGRSGAPNPKWGSAVRDEPAWPPQSQAPRGPARSQSPGQMSARPEMGVPVSRRPIPSVAASPSRSGGAFDVAGMITSFQAAMLVVGLTLLAPMFGGEGLVGMREQLGNNFAAACFGVAAVLGFGAIRVIMLARLVESYALYAASAGQALVAACLMIVAGSRPDAGALPGIGPSLAPWAIFVVALGFTVFGLRRAQDELSGAQARSAYGGFLLVMSLGGALAAYRIARIAAGMM